MPLKGTLAAIPTLLRLPWISSQSVHKTGYTPLGLGYGGVAYALGEMPLPACALAAGLCGASGMLPDIDSGPGRPLREITSFLAVAVPAMLFGRLQHYGLSQSSIVLVGVAIYLTIRFGLAGLLRRYIRSTAACSIASSPRRSSAN